MPETEAETFRIQDGIDIHWTAVDEFWCKRESFRISGTGDCKTYTWRQQQHTTYPG